MGKKLIHSCYIYNTNNQRIEIYDKDIVSIYYSSGFSINSINIIKANKYRCLLCDTILFNVKTETSKNIMLCLIKCYTCKKMIPLYEEKIYLRVQLHFTTLI